MNDPKLLRVASTVASNLTEITDVRAPGRADYYFYFRSRVFSVSRGETKLGTQYFVFAAYPKWTMDVSTLVSYIEHGYEDESLLGLTVNSMEFKQLGMHDYAEVIFSHVHSRYVGLDDLLRDLGIE